MSSQDAILEELRELRAELGEFRAETRGSIRALRGQLQTVEFGVLTIAQKLLAESEVAEIRSKMMRRETVENAL